MLCNIQPRHRWSCTTTTHGFVTDLNELRPVEQFLETNGKSSYKPYFKINLVKIMLAYSEISNKAKPTRTQESTTLELVQVNNDFNCILVCSKT